MALKHRGNAVFVDEDPVDVSEMELVHPKDWIPWYKKMDLGDWNFYPYVEFPSLERAYYGLVLYKGKKFDFSIHESVDRPMLWNEPLAPVNDFGEAIRGLEKGSHSFEEYPYVEVKSVEEYHMLLEARDPIIHPKDWYPGTKRKKPDFGDWKGPGVYDVRDNPPTKSYKSVDDYQLQSMEHAADETLEFMFQGDEWKDLVRKMVEDNRDKIFS